jgi:molybdate transport system substrate-binding protein
MEALLRARSLLFRLLLPVFVLVTAGLAAQRAAADQPVIVFAAASLKDALDEAAKSFRASGGIEARISYAGSLALARQLEQGAPADLFISADLETMDYAASKKAINPASRFDLLQNRLVLVAAKSSRIDILPLTAEALTQALGGGRLTTGEVKSVPVGRYAQAALQKLGLWSTIEPRLAMTDNVRAALAFVTRGEAPLGIVYATDAAADPGVKVVAQFPADSHPPIIYPLALTAGTKNPAAPKLLAFLRSNAGRAVFEKHGFMVLE